MGAADERRVLLLGGSGQVGMALRARAWPEDVALVAPTRTETDVTSAAAVAEAVAAWPWTAVVNAAAWTDVDAAEGAPERAFAVNADAPARLAERTRERGIPLIHISSDYVFDGTKDGFYDEDDRAAPINVYGASKLAGEEAVRAANPRHLVIRTAWVCSRRGRNFMTTMLRLAGERRTLRVVDDQHGTPTAADDLAAVLAGLALRPDLPERRGTYHFANRGATTWCGLARRILAASAAHGGPGAEIEAIATADYPTAARRPANSRLATDKIERDLGILPPAWEEAVDRLFP